MWITSEDVSEAEADHKDLSLELPKVVTESVDSNQKPVFDSNQLPVSDSNQQPVSATPSVSDSPDRPDVSSSTPTNQQLNPLISNASDWYTCNVEGDVVM